MSGRTTAFLSSSMLQIVVPSYTLCHRWACHTFLVETPFCNFCIQILSRRRPWIISCLFSMQHVFAAMYMVHRPLHRPADMHGSEPHRAYSHLYRASHAACIVSIDAAGAWWEPLHTLYQSTVPLSLTKASQQYHAYIYVYDHSHYHQSHATSSYSFIAYKHFGDVMPMQ
jgi:hypothetical protein